MSLHTTDNSKANLSPRSPTSGAAVLSAGSLDSNDIFNLQDEKLGSVKEIMIDTGTGKVAYVVLSSGGLLGIGDRLFAIPWNALSLDTENKRFVLDAAVDRIKNAPGFDKENWPNMADKSWVESLHSYYGTSSDFSRN